MNIDFVQFSEEYFDEAKVTGLLNPLSRDKLKKKEKRKGEWEIPFPSIEVYSLIKLCEKRLLSARSSIRYIPLAKEEMSIT
jgi:hypothetical protein